MQKMEKGHCGASVILRGAFPRAGTSAVPPLLPAFQAAVARLAQADAVGANAVIDPARARALGGGVSITGSSFPQGVLLGEHQEQVGLKGHGLVEPESEGDE